MEIKYFVLIIILILGCKSKNDFINNRAAQECRLMGDLDGDESITGLCCEETSCQNNPALEINPPCDHSIGDAGAIFWLAGGNLSEMGCDELEEWEMPPTANNCHDFYWIDVNGDNEIAGYDAGCVAQLHAGLIGTNNNGNCCVPDNSDSPCAGKCVGEKCCIYD